jgi:hypothetical protein
MSKLAFKAQTVDIAYLPLRQDFLAKNVLMTVQRDFRLDNSPSISKYTPEINRLQGWVFEGGFFEM